MTDFCSENIYIDMTPRVERREWDSNPRVQGHQLARQFKFHDLEADPF